MSKLTPIKLGLFGKLRNVSYRRRFFKTLAQDSVAQQIRELRKLRHMTQKKFSKLTGMRQSAVSRIEQAEYSSWSFKTLIRSANALDARLKIIFQPSEEAIKEFENLENAQSAPKVRVTYGTFTDSGIRGVLFGFGQMEPNRAAARSPLEGQRPEQANQRMPTAAILAG